MSGEKDPKGAEVVGGKKRTGIVEVRPAKEGINARGAVIVIASVEGDNEVTTEFSAAEVETMRSLTDEVESIKRLDKEKGGRDTLKIFSSDFDIPLNGRLGVRSTGGAQGIGVIEILERSLMTMRSKMSVPTPLMEVLRKNPPGEKGAVNEAAAAALRSFSGELKKWGSMRITDEVRERIDQFDVRLAAFIAELKREGAIHNAVHNAAEKAIEPQPKGGAIRVAREKTSEPGPLEARWKSTEGMQTAADAITKKPS